MITGAVFYCFGISVQLHAEVKFCQCILPNQPGQCKHISRVLQVFILPIPSFRKCITLCICHNRLYCKFYTNVMQSYTSALHVIELVFASIKPSVIFSYPLSCRFGPLRNQWCMRFELKNAQIKSFVTHSFKNVPMTVAIRHQLAMCYSLACRPGQEVSHFLYNGDELMPGKPAQDDKIKIDGIILHCI